MYKNSGSVAHRLVLIGVLTPLNPMRYSMSTPEPDFREYQDLVGRSYMCKLDIKPKRLAYEEFLKACPAAKQFSSNFKYLDVHGFLGDDGQDCIIDPSLSVADWMVAHKTQWSCVW